MRRVWVELARIGAGEAALVTGELADRGLQAEAQPEVRHAVLTRVARRRDLALEATGAEAAGHDDAVEVGEAPFGQQPFGVDARDPVDVDLRAAREAAVAQ